MREEKRDLPEAGHRDRRHRSPHRARAFRADKGADRHGEPPFFRRHIAHPRRRQHRHVARVFRHALCPGRGDYLNCPLTREEYDVFYDALRTAGRVDLKEFEETPYFEGCLPIEVMAERGRDTLALRPHEARRPDATKGRAASPTRSCSSGGRTPPGACTIWSASRRSSPTPSRKGYSASSPACGRRGFSGTAASTGIPSSTRLPCLSGLQLEADGRIFFAGQITGVEGYMESTAMGLLAGRRGPLLRAGKGVCAARADHLHRGALPVHRDGEEGFPAHERELRPPRGVPQAEEGAGGRVRPLPRSARWKEKVEEDLK